ncbi:MAG TPA: DNA-binding protein [Planctomycetaceae bacterium]|jgi:hypothetical protein|nr:DNA-binding protein [Planctomycetaceae bacterium]
MTEMYHTDFQRLADSRIQEAAALLELTTPLPNGAFYLAGYSVECALKACIAKKFGQGEWPRKDFVLKCHTHDLNKLFECADLTSLRDAEFRHDVHFGQNWSIVKDWSESSRYETHHLREAQELVNAIQDIDHGVLRWIRQYW